MIQAQNTELNRIFNELKSKTPDQKEKAAEDIKNFYNNYQDTDDILTRLQKAINSQDSNEKIGGLIALDKLTSVIPENQVFSFVNKFLSQTFQQFLYNDISIYRKTADVLGKLLRIGDIKIAQVVEQDVDEAIKWLKQDGNNKETRRIAGILALKELLKEAPFITFNKIFSNSKDNFQLVWNVIRDKKIDIRKEALELLNECNKQISQRELMWQQEKLQQIYEYIKKSYQNNDSDVIHGNILALKSLLLYAKEEVFFQDWKEMCSYVLSKKDLKNQYIQFAVIETIPVLAKFGKGFFVLEFLNQCILYLRLQAKRKDLTLKEKGQCYKTLSDLFQPLDLGILEEEQNLINLKLLINSILEDLKLRMKPQCNEALVCLESLSTKFRKKFIDHVDIHTLIDEILLNGLSQQSVAYLEHLQKLEIPGKISEYIQCKLLLTIQIILTGKIYQQQQKDTPLDRVIIDKFQQSLQLEKNSNDFKSIEAKALSIQTLSSFNFEAYSEGIAVFVKDCVLTYLDDKNPIIRKAAAKAGCLLYVRKQQNQVQQINMISKNLMYDILEKFLSVTISDPNDEIRQTMLTSLNYNFDEYLNSPNNLKKLFLCASDNNPEVQELALTILCRLSRDNPSDVIPFLKKTIYQYLYQLSVTNNLIHKENRRVEIIKLLTTIIEQGQNIILPQTHNIARILINNLKEFSNSQVLMASLLKAVSYLYIQANENMIPYDEDLIPILLNIMQDKSSTKKRLRAIETFVSIIKSTGFVILPYYKYPQLLENIFMLIKIESNLDMRCEFLRLIGTLGAIDSYAYKKAMSQITETQSDKYKKIRTFQEIKQYGLKLPIIYMKNYELSKNLTQNLEQELYRYYDDLIIIGNFNNQKDMFLQLSEYQQQKLQDISKYTSNNNDSSQLNNQKQINNNNLNSQIEELIKSPDTISLNNPDYYYIITIKTLLKILCDPSLHNHHDLAIETLKIIFQALKTKCANFLYLILPVFEHIIPTVEKTENLLKLIERIIKYCERGFQIEYIDSVLKIFQKYVNIMEPKITAICLDILNTLIQVRRQNLKYKIEPCINTIKVILIQSFDYEENKENKDLIKKSITILENLEELVDPYISLIIQILCRLLTKDYNNSDQETCIDIIHLLNSFACKCPSLIQYLSIIVQNLILLLEQCSNNTSQNIKLQNLIMNCIVVFIYKYKNNFLVYLPRINQYVQSLKIYHNEYQKCVEILLNYGNLEELGNLIDDTSNNLELLANNQQKSNSQNQQQYTMIATEYNPPHKKLNGEAVKNEFDTNQKIMKEDWNEWMRRCSVEMLKHTPNPIITSCFSIAEVYNQIANELFNVAFASCWYGLLDKQKEFIIKHLHYAIQASNIPTSILQTILNLAEFMQHDKEGLQIDNSTLGDLAQRCMAYAKALYFRELEFETASEKTVESLIELYINVGQPEAANGLLIYANKQLHMDLKNLSYENLFNWEEALNDYTMKQLNPPEGSSDQDYFIPKIKCLHALSDWETILLNCDKADIINSSNPFNSQRRQQVSWIASNAALNLGEWTKLEQYVEIAPQEPGEKNFYQAIIGIQNNKLNQARTYIKKTREVLDGKLSGLLTLESYGRAYDNILKLQQLVEMEEIIEIKDFQNKINLLKQSETKHEMQKEFEKRKKYLQELWQDRLLGCEKNVDVWQKILSIRGLLLDKKENINCWLKFIKLTMKSDQQQQLGLRTLQQLKLAVNQHPKSEFDYPSPLILQNLICQYKMGMIDDQILTEKMTTILTDKTRQDLDSFMRAEGFLRLGKLFHEKTEEPSEQKIEEIMQHYKSSITNKNDYSKSWHKYALLNFESIHLLKDKKSQNHIIQNYVYEAVKGFIKAISLGYKNDFQDSLRLLNIIFQYGDRNEIAEEFRLSFNKIDIISWIKVVPQIMARIDINNPAIQRLLHQILIHISKDHPQALIYQLTMAAKSKSNQRKKSAKKVLEEMSKLNKESKTIVEQALMISEELIRTAILLKEIWSEGIEEAWKHYSNDKNFEATLRVLNSLHDRMKETPESLNEITFHQSYGQDINEAAAWLKQYERTKEQNNKEMCLNQMFDIYYTLYKKFNQKLENMKMVFLENVSPKLLQTKNCELSVPGLYEPKSNVIRIAGFSSKLPVLSSKQHPRRMVIYGSDSKEYHFLLKGHEDLRQDERVMQLFQLVNRLLQNYPKTEKKDLSITRYAVIPLSTNTGLIGWVHNCDTLQQLVRDFREQNNIRPGTENALMQSMCTNYDTLPLPNKVEIFRHILENTKGEDLQKVLWLRSPNSEIWLERRTNYTRSLATMSMVGYILGLGDRHPSNIMIQRLTGKIVHIDFGDCWEVANKREKFPEKVPFRLTRMLVKAMEACQIEGTFRNTCEIVMEVLRDNKESLMAVLEAFVYDPLLNWKLVTETDVQAKQQGRQSKQFTQQPPVDGNIKSSMISNIMVPNRFILNQQNSPSSKQAHKDSENIIDQSPKRKEVGRERIIQCLVEDDSQDKPQEILNQKALAVVDRIKKKLAGRDFNENEQLNVKEQVNKLIRQATSHENICQAYLGWCPFW